MNCPKCNSTNVTVTREEVGSKTKKKGVGAGGHINNTARGLTAVCTLGLSNIVWKKSKGTNKTTNQNVTIGICQDCGNTWEI